MPMGLVIQIGYDQSTAMAEVALLSRIIVTALTTSRTMPKLETTVEWLAKRQRKRGTPTRSTETAQPQRNTTLNIRPALNQASTSPPPVTAFPANRESPCKTCGTCSLREETQRGRETRITTITITQLVCEGAKPAPVVTPASLVMMSRIRKGTVVSALRL